MPSNLIHVPLGPMDHLPPPTPQPGLIYLGIKPGVSNEEVFAHLQEGLYQTFLRAPWLNGKIHAQSPETPGWRPGQLEIRYNPNLDDTDKPKCYQLHLNEIETDTSFEELKMNGFPIDAFEDEALTYVSYKPQGADFEAGVEIVAAQANFIPGACLLVPSVHHAACDATGMGIFLRIWGDHCRLLSLQSQGRAESVQMLPEENWDRSFPDRIWVKEATGHSVAGVSPATWQLIGLDSPGPGSNGLVPPKRVRPPLRQQSMSSRLFYMSATAFKELRDKSNRELETTDLSGNDVILALLWRILIRARIAARERHDTEAKIDMDSLIELQIVHDARPGFSQALPPFYMGNCVFYHRPTVPLQALIGPASTIAQVAQAIRTSTRNINHESIMDAYSLLQQMPDWTRLQPLRHMTVADTWMMSSMIAVPEDTTSFGDRLFTNGGRHEGVRMLMGNRNRSQVPACYVMPRKKHGGLELAINVFEDEWPFVMDDEEFGHYTSLLA